MNRPIAVLLTLILTVLFSFVAGVAVLFLVIIPLDAFLRTYDVAQVLINFVVAFPIFFWFVLSLLAALFFYYQLTHSRRRVLVGVVFLLLLSFFSGAGMFFLTHTENPVLKLLQGKREETAEQVIFGPYPEENTLKSLKQQGITDVISLLNPSIPFEKVLLLREMEAGKKVGITVHSVPMLPWVSKNSEALEEIKKLLAEPSRRYYIHCYLGKHRVDLVRQMLAAGGKVNQVREVIFPDHLERGRVVFLSGGRYILGPMPTEEEWFNAIARGRFTTVISFLDPKNPDDVPWVEKEKEWGRNLGIKVLFVPFSYPPRPAEKDKLANLLGDVQGRFYIHGFRGDDPRLSLVEGYLRCGRWLPSPLPSLLARKGTVVVVPGLYLGPAPSSAQVAELQKAGWRVVGNLTSENHLSLPEMARRLEETVAKEGLPAYFYGFAGEEQLQAVAGLLRRYHYGMEELPPALAAAGSVKISGFIAVGPLQSEKMAADAAAAGIRTVVFLAGRDGMDEKGRGKMLRILAGMGVKGETVPYREGYENEIILLSQREGPCYVVVASPAGKQVTGDLRARLLQG